MSHKMGSAVMVGSALAVGVTAKRAAATAANTSDDSLRMGYAFLSENSHLTI
jgi:hypothetical protein